MIGERRELALDIRLNAVARLLPAAAKASALPDQSGCAYQNRTDKAAHQDAENGAADKKGTRAQPVIILPYSLRCDRFLGWRRGFGAAPAAPRHPNSAPNAFDRPDSRKNLVLH